MTGYWLSFLCVFMGRDEVEVHGNAKRNDTNNQPSGPGIILLNKGFIIWQKTELLLAEPTLYRCVRWPNRTQESFHLADLAMK